MPTLVVPNLFARRSIRRYTEQPVEEEKVQVLLQAAMAAPSAANYRPWHFVVVTDATTRAALAQANQFVRMLAEAPLCIVPCGELALSHPRWPEFWVQDLSAATENLLLAATALGMGAVWCGCFPKPDRIGGVRRILDIPEGVVPLGLIAVGYPAEEKEPRTQYDPERVHRGRW